MKKVFLICVMALICFSCGRDKSNRKEPDKHLEIPYNAIKIDENGGYIKESAVVEIPNMNASQLYKKILEWEKKYDFKANKASIEKDQELILLEGPSIENKKVEMIVNLFKAAYISGSLYDLMFHLKILLKEGRYNFKISHVYFLDLVHEKQISPKEMSPLLQKSINPDNFNYFYNKVNNFHLSLFNHLTDGVVNKDIEKNENEW